MSNLNKLVQPECGAPNPLVSAAQRISMRPSTSTGLHFRPPVQMASNMAKEFLQKDQSSITSLLDGRQGLQKIEGNVSLSNPTNNYAIQKQSSQEQRQQSTSNIMMGGGYNMSSGSTSSLAGISSYPSQLQRNHIMNYQLDRSQGGNAGDQLELKYRNDMISSISQKEKEELGRYDDMEFWESLSQKYVGPTTMDNTVNSTQSVGDKDEQASMGKVAEDENKLDEISDQLASTQLEDDETSDLFSPSYGETFGKDSVNDLTYTFDDRNPLINQFEDPFAEGLKALDRGDIPSAALLFEAAVLKDGENARAWRYLGTTQAQNENDISAIRALRNCLKLDPTDQEARLAISVSLANETLQHEACENLLAWLISHPAYSKVGASLEQFHQFDSELSNDPFFTNSIYHKHYNYVRDKFVEAARMNPNDPDPEVQNSLGVIFNISGEYDKAVDCFKAALSVKSNDSLLWNRLGATLANGNKSYEAVIAYRKALEISPGFLRSRYNLAISLIHLNTYEEAAKQLVQILNMQAAGKGSQNSQIRTRSITSTSIWNTLRTVATLSNIPDLYSIIDGRDLNKINDKLFKASHNISGDGDSTPQSALGNDTNN